MGALVEEKENQGGSRRGAAETCVVWQDEDVKSSSKVFQCPRNHAPGMRFLM